MTEQLRSTGYHTDTMNHAYRTRAGWRKLFVTATGAAMLTGGCQPLMMQPTPDLSALPPWDLGEIRQTFEVSSVVDAGPGTLRDAIERANRSPGTDKIIFQSRDGLYQTPQTIYLNSPLPAIQDNLLIDGYIEDMLWKASGVTLDGRVTHAIIRIDAQAKVKIKHLTLANGIASRGGAIYAAGELVVEGSTFNGNTAADSGGAIYATGPRTIIFNSTFYTNAANRQGGALFNATGLLILTNTTFTDNRADRGGAVFNQSLMTIGNSILTNSSVGEDCHSTGTINANIKNIIETHIGCGEPYSREDPRLGSPQYFNGPVRTISLGMRSPAINYGDNSAAVDEYGRPLKWDQRGNGDPRDASGITDIGAFESQSQNLIEVDTLEDADYRWCTVFKNDCSLRGALLLAANDKRFSTITFNSGVFTQPATLTLREPLPTVSDTLTLDASQVPPVTLSFPNSTAFDQQPGKILLKNILIAN